MKMLRIARKKAGLTMKELGNIVGVSESAISQYENGKREADFETVLKIGEALNCTIDYLLRGIESKTPTTNGERDIIAEVDVAFYGDYKELSEANRETIRAMARLLKEQEAKKQ